MPRSLPGCLLAASLLACQPLGKDPGDHGLTTGASTADETAAPTTGDDHGETTAPSISSTVGSSDDSSGGDTSYGECPPPDVRIEVVAPRVMLVLDKSGSMVSDAARWDDDADELTQEVTRWHSLHQTIAVVLEKFAGRFDFGAVLFPSLAATQDYSAAACPVLTTPEVPVGPYQAAQILAAIPGADDLMLHGGTPTTAAIRTAVMGLASDDPADAARPQFIVLVTDGAANCSEEFLDDPKTLFETYDEQLALVVADALAQGISTHIIGIAIADEVSDETQDGDPDLTNNFARLNALAEAGGQARPGPERFHGASNQLELMEAMEQIFAVMTSCSIPFEHPLSPAFVREVQIGSDGPDPLEFGADEVQDCATESGWRYTSDQWIGIELCGAACTAFQRSGALNIEFDCYVE